MTTIGIIGGTGLYNLDGMSSVREFKVDTPFGEPSDVLTTGELDGVRLVFVPRHGRGHRLLPTEVPYAANVFALKSLGVEWLLSVSAVGSMKEELPPGTIVLPDQYIDRTRGARRCTFFGEGLVAHVSVADPVCPALVAHLAETVASCDIPYQRGGTYVCIEGPAFSTRAESETYRSWNVDVIGMTALPEAKLAREAELHYATVALVTDYDCWHESEDDVNADAVMQTLASNTANVRRVLEKAVPKMAALADECREQEKCGCHRALATAVLTDSERVPPDRLEALHPIVGKYLG